MLKERTWIAIMSLLVSAGVALWVNHQNTEIDKLKIEIDQHKARSSYFELLKDVQSPAYVKGLALSSLLRHHLLEPDLIFAAGYGAENCHGTEILKDLFYEYAQTPKPMQLPIGYVDLDGTEVNKTEIIIRGWALDSKEVTVWFDNDPKSVKKDNVVYGVEREDIDAVFKKYPNARKSGFKITVQRKEYGLGDGKHRLKVKLENSMNKFVHILDTTIDIRKNRATRVKAPECLSRAATR